MSHIQLVLESFEESLKKKGKIEVELSEIANGGGVSLRSVQRAVDDLREAGVIEGARGRYSILNEERFQGLVNGTETLPQGSRPSKEVAARPQVQSDKPACGCEAQLEHLQEVLSSIVADVKQLAEAFTSVVIEVKLLRSEVAALRASSVQAPEPKPSEPAPGQVLIRRQGQPLTSASDHKGPSHRTGS
jgi:DNA-binding Lrp family transcriptional regulator